MFERFVFDSTPCDQYGIMCATFSSSTMETILSQSTDLRTEKSVRGNVYHIISQEYSNPLTYTMQVVNKDFRPITAMQERALKKWLCQRNRYKPFCILDKHYADIWFFANISNPKSIFVADTVGLEFTVTTNAPFGFSDIRSKKWVMEENDVIDDFYVDTDGELPIYPDLTITVNRSGTLTLTNESVLGADHTLSIKNCTAGEIIHLECAYPHISSSVKAHNIFDDFNKFWPYLIDGYNRIAVDLPCTLEFQYREHRKVGIV